MCLYVNSALKQTAVDMWQIVYVYKSVDTSNNIYRLNFILKSDSEKNLSKNSFFFNQSIGICDEDF